MRRQFTLIIIFVAVWLLSGCAPAGDTSAPGAGTPSAAQSTGGNRAVNSTPGAQQQRRAQGTPQTSATPATQTNPEAGSTPSASEVVTPTTSAQTAPTAVPIPNIVIPTPLPDVSVNASPTAVAATSINLPARLTPTPVPQAPTAKASAVTLESLKGKIVFFSDRGGLYPQLYVMNPDGSDPQLCNCSDLLPSLVSTDASSPDKTQTLFVKQLGTAHKPDFQIWAHDSQTNQDQALTGAAGTFPGVDYDPTWSPDSRHIAWVTEANGFDEIYAFDRVSNENTRLTESHGEWYKHPSYSPDGKQLVYWTNLGNLNQKQIWVMNADGSQQHNISNNQFNDWDPIWVR